jgi:membrane protease YdiL (CAAX protease family)
VNAVQRALLFLLGYFALLWVASIPKGMVPPAYADLTWGASASVAIFALTRFFLSREQRTLREIGLSPDGGSFMRLLIGVGLGIGVYAVTLTLISLLVGPLRFTAVTPPSAATILQIVAGVLALSSMEELGFRGYPLRTLIPAIGHWQAQVVVAIAFGLGHLLFGWTWQSVALGVMPSALLFGAAARVSGGLAMPIGLHAAVNFAMWVVGEKASVGFGTLDVDPAAVARVTAVAPFIGAAVPIGTALLLFWWHQRHVRRAL